MTLVVRLELSTKPCSSRTASLRGMNTTNCSSIAPIELYLFRFLDRSEISIGATHHLDLRSVSFKTPNTRHSPTNCQRFMISCRNERLMAIPTPVRLIIANHVSNFCFPVPHNEVKDGGSVISVDIMRAVPVEYRNCECESGTGSLSPNTNYIYILGVLECICYWSRYAGMRLSIGHP